MENETMNPTPLRIVWIKNEKSETEVEFVINADAFLLSDISIRGEITSVKKKYLDIVEKSTQIRYPDGTKRIKSKSYRKISQLIGEFTKEIESEFVITNLPEALQNDFGITDSWIGYIERFSQLFKEDEISDKIPFSVYYEIMAKKAQLDEFGLYENEKSKLAQAAKNNKVPGHKEYRKQLEQLINSGGN